MFLLKGIVSVQEPTTFWRVEGNLILSQSVADLEWRPTSWDNMNIMSLFVDYYDMEIIKYCDFGIFYSQTFTHDVQYDAMCYKYNNCHYISKKKTLIFTIQEVCVISTKSLDSDQRSKESLPRSLLFIILPWVVY